MNVLGFIKKRWEYLLTALIALVIGATFGPSQEQLDSANAKANGLQEELAVNTETVTDLEAKNKELQDKDGRSCPFFQIER